MGTGLLSRTEKSVLFVIPWGEHWLIGDTDTEWPYDPGHPAASRADIDYLLAKVNRMLREPIGAGDIEGVFAGLRPLVAGTGAADGTGTGTGETAKLSREHTVDTSRPGVSAIAGGKFTTYRVMARDLIDAAGRDLGVIPASRTHEVPLLGAAGYAARWDGRERVAAGCGLPVSQVERLLGRYGSCLDGLLELTGGRPELGQPLGGPAVTWRPRSSTPARTRARCGWTTRWPGGPGSRSRPATGGWPPHRRPPALMAAELGWDDARTRREVAQYGQAVAAELAAQAEPDDRLAYQARAKARDPAPFYGSAPAEANDL
jgi:glycerol-3-phosphate dehydrogenase